MKITRDLLVAATKVETSLNKLLEKFDPSQPRDDDGRFTTGGGSGSSGGGSSSGSDYESYNDKIEGTQKEADREVKRCDKAVNKCREALETFKAKVAADVAGKKAAVKYFEKRLDDNRAKQSSLMNELSESKKRMAALKAQLKEVQARQSSRRRKSANDQSSQELLQSIDGELKVVADAAKTLKAITADLTELLNEIIKKNA